MSKSLVRPPVRLVLAIIASAALIGIPSLAAAAAPDIPGTTVQLPFVESGTVPSADSDQVYAVYVEAGQTLKAELYDVDSSLDLYLYGPSATTVRSVSIDYSAGTGTFEFLDYLVEESGYYYIDVYGDDAGGDYDLTSWLAGDGSDIPTAIPASLPMSNWEGALSFTPIGDPAWIDTDDVYRVYLRQGEKISLTLDGSPFQGQETDFDLFLYGPTAQDIETDLEVESSESEGSHESIVYTATSTGYHYIDVQLVYGGGLYWLSGSSILPAAKVYTPAIPSKVSRNRAVTASGYLQPRHASGTYAVKLYCEHYESGRWKQIKVYNAKVADYSGYSKYKGAITLTKSGKWRIRAGHADSGHRASYSAWVFRTVR